MNDTMPYFSHIEPDIRDGGTQARLEQLHRFAQVGRCVNGVTHDVNNALGAILAYAELIALDESLNAESQRMANEIIHNVGKCTELVARLTDIARDEKPSVSIIELGAIVKRALLLRSYSLRVAKVKVETDIQEGLPSIEADVPKLQLVFIHLLFNAQEALEQCTDKRMRVRVYQEGEHLVAEIWNSAPGLDTILPEHFAVPYHTSKEGFHFGLSLPAALRYVTLHKGTLTCTADRGFVMTLPLQTGL